MVRFWNFQFFIFEIFEFSGFCWNLVEFGLTLLLFSVSNSGIFVIGVGNFSQFLQFLHFFEISWNFLKIFCDFWGTLRPVDFGGYSTTRLFFVFFSIFAVFAILRFFTEIFRNFFINLRPIDDPEFHFRFFQVFSFFSVLQFWNFCDFRVWTI